jgi:hypothetical protein
MTNKTCNLLFSRSESGRAHTGKRCNNEYDSSKYIHCYYCNKIASRRGAGKAYEERELFEANNKSEEFNKPL